MLNQRLSKHLQQLTDEYPAIKLQFTPSAVEALDEEVTTADPLLEEEFTVTRGLVHKYNNRALVLLTMNCAAYCRFCTRRRSVSDIKRGMITDRDLDQMVFYLKQHPEIKELIFSGGDPLTVPLILKKALKKLSNLAQIKVIRIGSRLPVANPAMINHRVIEALKVVKKQPLYLMLHFEHPAEINPPTIRAVRKLQTVSGLLFSQSVFLKKVNDDTEILYTLFSRLIELGIKPYYIYRCDYVKGAERFIVELKKEIEIMTDLRKRLSGLACPLYVIDTYQGSGKVPVPLNFWQFKLNGYHDFTDQPRKNVKI